MEFTFAVLAYNQAEIILETLESIKYQIETFGKDRVFNLIVTDDCSHDKTAEMVMAWIDYNKTLFKKNKVIKNKYNIGTVKNYNIIMQYIKNEQFKVIAGDDIIGPNNIFTDLSNDFRVIDTYPFYSLRDGKVEFQKKYLYDYFYRYHFYKPSKNLTWMRMGDFMHTPSTFYHKDLYLMSRASDYNKDFCLFEDDPTFYCFFKNVSDVVVKFHEQPLILYRYTTASTSTVPNERFLHDWRLLQCNYENDSSFPKNLFFKLRKKSDFSKDLNCNRICNSVKIVCRKMIVKLFYKKEFECFLRMYSMERDKFDRYYFIIKEKACSFKEEVRK